MKIKFTKFNKKTSVLITSILLLVIVAATSVFIVSKRTDQPPKDIDIISHSTAFNETNTQTKNDIETKSDVDNETDTNNEVDTDSETINSETNMDNETNTNKETYTQATNQDETTASWEGTPEQKVEKILNQMTLEEKVYQMFIITPEALTDGNNVTISDDYFRERLQQYPVGGIIYFAKNLINRDQTTQMLQNTKQYAYEIEGIPMFLCVDEEGGRVARIANNPNFGVPQVGAMQYIGSADNAYKAGQTIGSYLNELGFNLDFAPVADVITNYENTVIGDRSFGTNANIVSEYAASYSNGLHSYNILSTFKHFPGHGATQGDTHEGFAYTSKTYEELLETELVPFANAQNNGIDVVMVAHISVPNIVGDNTPCTLSYKMISEILRGDLKYNGLVITDAMNMGAIFNNYDSDAAVVLAVLAGVDLILMPSNFVSAAQSVINAVQNGQISESRIDTSVRRIIRKKLQIG